MSITSIDMNEINALKETMKTKFSMVVEFFLEDAALYVAQIKQGIADQQLDPVIAAAHTLKYSCKQLGALQMAPLVEQLEADAKAMQNDAQQDIIALSVLAEKLDHAFQSVKPLYQDMLVA